jgi:hypothetical protein
LEKKTRMNRIRLTVTLAISALVGFVLLTNQVIGQGLRQKMELVGFSVPFAERAGSDDGVAFAIQFMGSTHGSLDTCG